MVFSLLTVVFYTASSLGDKYISAKLACSAQEFSFLVALSIAFFPDARSALYGLELCLYFAERAGARRARRAEDRGILHERGATQDGLRL